MKRRYSWEVMLAFVGSLFGLLVGVMLALLCGLLFAGVFPPFVLPLLTIPSILLHFWVGSVIGARLDRIRDSQRQ